MSESREPLFHGVKPLDSIPTPSKREKHSFSLPKSVADRLRTVIVAERRTQMVVFDKVVSDFIASPINNTPPYIPYQYANEPREKFNLMMRPEVYSELTLRSYEEGREIPTMILRAVLDYLDASPDDPAKSEAVA